MKRHFFLLLFCCFLMDSLFAQYTMSNQTVNDCEGVLTDSESNAQNSGWYSNNENFSFTICPNGAFSITIDFSFFLTEPINDYVVIYDGPNNTYPVLGGPYSGTNLPPQINSSGCVTIVFVSDVNVTSEGFELSWTSQISTPAPPTLTLPSLPVCSSSVINILLDQNIHCDSVSTAQIFVGNQMNQAVIANAVNCINDSTNEIQLNLTPGLNESGVYDIYFQSYFLDACDSVWVLSNNMQFIINDCPLEVDIIASPDSVICQGDCVDLYVNVLGGDSSSYTYFWNPPLSNTAGPHNVCPSNNTVYSVIVSDAGPAVSQSDSILISVLPPPITQSPFDICQTASPINLTANPLGGVWSGTGILNSSAGIFSPNNLSAGVYTVSYSLGSCDDDLDITILEVNAGSDISVCTNTPVFNLNTPSTTPGGVWSGSSFVQSNGDIAVGASPIIISAIYTLPNGCSDTLLVNVVNNIVMPNGTTFCQQSGNIPLLHSPLNGVWSVLPNNTQLVSSCLNAIDTFPYQQGWEVGLNNWTHDPANDFDWILHNGSTPSSGTGPLLSYEGFTYIYTEASGNFPSQRAGLISPCINLSAYTNPILHFFYHKHGFSQGSFAVDVSVDDGLTWNWNHWVVYGDLGNQWNEASIDLSSFNNTEVRIRLRVITGDDYSSDVALDQLSILSGPVTSSGDFLTDVSNSGTHNLVYSIEGCNDFVDIVVNEINAGIDQNACPSETPFNLTGSPNGGIWNGNSITNNNLGTFDPSLNLGVNIITYSFGGCTDTTTIWVTNTDVQMDSFFVCLNSGLQQLDMTNIPRTPWNGIWNGSGILNTSFPGTFNPILAGVGNHLITYSANNCIDSLVFNVFPKAILLDTQICSNSIDVILDVIPSGGYWVGNGIIDNNTGLFSPSSLPSGLHMLGYQSPNGCVDTFEINLYDPPVLSILGVSENYCFKDTNIQVFVSPIGGVLSGNGVVGMQFNPSVAGEGYHNLTYTYGTGTCTQTIDYLTFVSSKLTSNSYSTKDTICKGDVVKIGSVAQGGLLNYVFSWNNGLSNSFEHLVAPDTSIDYIVMVNDGCSSSVFDTLSIFVYDSFDISFITSEKKCYGNEGFAYVEVFPQGNYSYLWDTDLPMNNDTLFSEVNKNYQVNVIDDVSGCIVSDTITIPGYSNIIASFFSSNTDCISILDASIQFNDNSFVNPYELTDNSKWIFGDGNITPYIYTHNPIHTFTDTGTYTVSLYLENNGGCFDSTNISVCVNPDNRLFVPNTFTPDNNMCNDEFYAIGFGGFTSFNIKIYKRWGSEAIFESDKIMLTDTYSDGNSCYLNQINVDLFNYYKMGVWDGKLFDGNLAPQGVYGYIIEFQTLLSSETQYHTGTITLIR